VVAAFDAGAVTSDAGALLLGATDRAIRMMDRLASCFHDVRCPEQRPWFLVENAAAYRLRCCKRQMPSSQSTGSIGSLYNLQLPRSGAPDNERHPCTCIATVGKDALFERYTTTATASIRLAMIPRSTRI